MITKNIDVLEYDDIKSLLDNKIPESDVLDYKEYMVSDDELIKHVTAFANSNGGHIIFGIKESGKGGYPIAVNGIESEKINKERIEQIILSNIFPRVQIKQKIIVTENENQFLVIQIPNSAYRPHFNNKSQRFYKRFQFESIYMQEDEISNMYKNRFHTLQDVKEYLQTTSIEFPIKEEILQLQIIIIPTRLNNQLIDVTDSKIYDWLNPNNIDYNPSGYVYAPHHGFLPSFSNPHKFGIGFNSAQGFQDGKQKSLYVHRNGCIHYIMNVGYEKEIPNRTKMPTAVSFIQYPILAVKLMHVLQFAEDVLSRYNYFGDVEILVKISSKNSEWGMKVGEFDGDFSTFIPPKQMSDKSNSTEYIRTLSFERSYPIIHLKTNFSQITSSIMNEIYNCFRIRKCPLFDETGQYMDNRF